MAWHIAEKDLFATSGAGSSIVTRVPQDGKQYVAVLRLSGTFTATAKVQSSTDEGVSYSDATVVNATSGATGNPTAAGVYVAQLASGAQYCRVILSSYTSGKARAQLALVPMP